MIVKVQRPLEPMDAPCLIYNKSRSEVETRYLSAKEREAMGKDMKAFFQAKNGVNKITLLKRIPDEDW